jgi:hypothetical protein
MANVAPHILKPFVKQVGDGHLGRRDQPFVPVLERLPELPAYFRLGLGVEVAGFALGVFVDGASSSEPRTKTLPSLTFCVPCCAKSGRISPITG